MLHTLPYTVDPTLLNEAQGSIPSVESKLTINQPTGNFFYDPWEVKEEFKGTVWETLLNTLPLDIGEARIIALAHGTTYMSHTDINLKNYSNITIKPVCENPRFEFDDLISPWLNKINKQHLINNFSILQDGVSFNLDIDAIHELDNIDIDKFKVIK